LLELIDIFVQMKMLNRLVFSFFMAMVFPCWSTNAIPGQHKGYQYISPAPGSRLHNVESCLILKVSGKLKDLSGNSIRVIGTKSGEIPGELFILDDTHTVIFDPYNDFTFGEKIEVHINKEIEYHSSLLPPLSFHFFTSEHPYSAIFSSERDQYIDLQPLSQAKFSASSTKTKYSSVNDSLPEGFPEIITQVMDEPLEGYNFISPLKYDRHFLIIIDNYGTPVFYRDTSFGACDFKLQPNGMLTYYDNKDRCFYGMDEQFNVIDTFRCQNGYGPYTDMHELRLKENGHYFILAYDPQIVNMDTVVPGGDPEATVTGLIVQEIDENDNVVFQWRSWDHFKITDVSDWEDLQASEIDYVHGNSIEIESDTSLLISCRNMNEITKIDRRTGEIIWRLNGKNNQFSFVNDPIRFGYQHSIRYMPDSNHFSIFDNGVGHSPVQFSSALEYKIDEENMTATLIKRIAKDPNIFGNYMGHTQRHADGWTTIGWGHVHTNITHGYPYVPGITEFREDGSISLEISFKPTSYRAFKFDWTTTALIPDRDQFVFDSISPGDSTHSTLYIRNSTGEAMVVNRILHHTDVFSCNIGNNGIIPAQDSVPAFFRYHPTEYGIFHDVFTFCCDTHEDGISQRIACQVNVTGRTTSISDNPTEDDYLFVYPNPASSTLNIVLKNHSNARAYLINTSGQTAIAFDISEGDNFIDVSTLESGVFLLRAVAGDDGIDLSKKIVIL